MKAENLLEKRNKLSEKAFIDGNVLEDLRDDEIGKAEDLSEKKLEAERESSDENVHDNLSENHVEKQDVEQPARTDTTLTEDVFHSNGVSENERKNSFSSVMYELIENDKEAAIISKMLLDKARQ